MRRSRGMTLVEVITAMLATLIIGGSAALFLKSGLDIEQANTISAANQQSLRTPVLRLTPLVERAMGVEILNVLPNKDDIKDSEVVFHIADPMDVTKTDTGQNNMYLRTRKGDSIVPGFSHIDQVRFERVILPPGTLADSRDHQAVRFSLTAKNSEKELVYSTDVRSLNRVPVLGPDSGPFLKIDLYGVPVLSSFIRYAEVSGGVVSADPIPNGTTTLVVGTNIAGYFQIFSGNASATIEYEWRLYKNILDVGTDQYEVIGKPGSSYPSPQNHYEDRFTTADVGVSPPTGTSAHTDPPYTLMLEGGWVNKHITFAVREERSAYWVESESYLITRRPAQSGEFWKDLIKQLRKDIKDVKDGKPMEDIAYEVLNPKETKTSMTFEEDAEGQTALTLAGTGSGGSNSFFSKLLEDRYFGYQTNGDRDPEFCLENYTLWVDATVSPPKTSGWGATINGNRKANQYGNPIKKEHLMYAYMLQFDPGLYARTHDVEFAGIGDYFKHHKTIKTIPNDLRVQGLIIRELTGLTQGYVKDGTGSGLTPNQEYMVKVKRKNAQGVVVEDIAKVSNNPGKGLGSMRRWKESTSQDVNPLDLAYSREFIGRLDSKDIMVNLSDWDSEKKEPSALAGVDYRYYFWRDIAYKGEGELPSDEFGGPYANRFAVNGDALVGMRNVRYTTEVNVITQTTVRPGSSPAVTEPDRIFFRVRVYDKPRVYDTAKKKWLFPRGTGRSKEMWFGLERGKEADWVLPANCDGVSYGASHLFEKGDVSYKLAPMENKKVVTNKWHTSSPLGKYLGMRVWNWTKENGSAFEAKIYFVDIAKGLPLDFGLPWGGVVGDVIKPIDEGGTWDPKNAYEVKQYE